ncbi:MAG: hypothetical protein HY235_27130 [Acidobacteria bacterium]|nr:hypothetical protein [Acidobacteriota bacterium]
MIRPHLFVVLALELITAGCLIEDPGPVEKASQNVDAGKVEAVRADIRMGAGELRLEGGASKLLEASFRYSRKLGKPEVRYDLTGFRGRLSIEQPKRSATSGNFTNEWTLRFGDIVPLDLDITLGAGQSRADLTMLPVHNVDARVGAGEFHLDLNGQYKHDVDVRLHGGVWSSPLLNNGLIYVMNKSGGTTVFQANPKQFEAVASNVLEEPSNSSVVISGGDVFLRTHAALWCIGRKE